MNTIKCDIVSEKRIEFLKLRPWYDSYYHTMVNKKLNSFVANTHIVACPNEHVKFSKDFLDCELFDTLITNVKLIQMIKSS